MNTLTYPSDRFPAPPSVSMDIPDGWEPVSVASVAIAARQSDLTTDFTANVIVRLGTRPGMDHPADALMELTGSMQGREGASVGEPETVDVDGVPFVGCEVSWTDGRGVPVRQSHLFTGLPREDGLQDFVHLTGSVGGGGAERDYQVVQQILGSVRVAR